jgi:hypothetical protein
VLSPLQVAVGAKGAFYRYRETLSWVDGTFTPARAKLTSVGAAGARHDLWRMPPLVAGDQVVFWEGATLKPGW